MSRMSPAPFHQTAFRSLIALAIVLTGLWMATLFGSYIWVWQPAADTECVAGAFEGNLAFELRDGAQFSLPGFHRTRQSFPATTRGWLGQFRFERDAAPLSGVRSVRFTTIHLPIPPLIALAVAAAYLIKRRCQMTLVQGLAGLGITAITFALYAFLSALEPSS
jgi:hypothetical protein